MNIAMFKIIFGTAPPIAPTFISEPRQPIRVSWARPQTSPPLQAAIPRRPIDGSVEAAGSGTWAAVANNSTFAGATSTNLTVSIASLSMSGDLYRCVATNSQGIRHTSAPPASLTVNTALVISTLAGQAGTLGTGKRHRNERHVSLILEGMACDESRQRLCC